MTEKNEKLTNPKPVVEVIYGGGTISSLATAEGYREGGHLVDLAGGLSARIPDFEDRFALGKKEVGFTGLSENMEPEDCDKIEEKILDALERDPRGVVVTLGTDAMEQVARRLDTEEMRQLLADKEARLILTAANDDISSSMTDAWDNLEFAFESAVGNSHAGVYVAFHQKLIPAERVVKKPFDFENDHSMSYIANDDPEYFAALQKQKVQEDQIITDMEAAFENKTYNNGIVSYEVNVVRQNHDALLEYVNSHSIRAVLLTLYHSGTANTENPQSSVASLVERLRLEKGIVFFGVTENGEPVNLRGYETSVKLREAGVVPLYDMPKAVAQTKLRLIDGETTGAQLVTAMLTNKAGEITESTIVSDDIDQLIALYEAA